jgi:hypothetical protein
LPVPHKPQDFGVPVQEGSAPPALEAKTESFFDNLVEPQCGQGVPAQSLERTRISLSLLHFSQ